MRIGLLGAGVVGRRVARELVGLPSVSAVVLLSGAPKERERLRESLGPKAEAAPANPLRPTNVDVVVLSGPDDVQVDQARDALAAGSHAVCLADSVTTIEALTGLHDYAREVGRSVIVGTGMSPGWTTILARHASTLFDDIDEISIAVTGSGGPACVERRTRAARSDTQEWRDGEWVEFAARSGSELVWFPDPLGAVDCGRGDLSEGVLLRRILPDVPLLMVKMGRPTARPLPRRMQRFRRTTTLHEQGGIRVAVSGRLDGHPSTVVYGMLSSAVTSSAVLTALTVEALTSGTVDAGVFGVAEALDPVRLLQSAAARGVRGLVYDGID